MRKIGRGRVRFREAVWFKKIFGEWPAGRGKGAGAMQWKRRGCR